MRRVALSLRCWFNAGLGLIYPETCQLCRVRRAEPRDGLVCPQCWAQVRFIRPPFCERCGLPFHGDLTTTFECANCREMKLHFSSARSAAVARSVVLEAIHRFKYSHSLWFEDFLAGLLVREAGGFVTDFRGRSPAICAETVLASNDSMHPKLLKLLAGANKAG